ncbi:MAG: NAD-dependent epimerase/dehydratase family protein [Anaerolineae bacterium]|nr:NAD-dependent epimerase/dehydratase family protein [Anaerolineae bacterium]
MRILITGGAGFLGSALANALVKQGHEVMALDDLSSGNPDYLDSRVLFHRGSIANRPKLWTLLQGVDCVYHLAARVLVAESILYPREYNEVNVGGTLALLESMRDVQVPKLIFTSSGAIYGEQVQQPVIEEMIPNPRSPYAVSKLSTEYYAHTIGSLWNITTVSLRIFNAYGPGQPLLPSHSPVIPRFLHQALGGGSVVIFGSGTQTRDFVYVDDVVTALIAAATAKHINRQTINVGSGIDTSINALANLILKLTNSSSSILHSTTEDNGVSKLQADIALAKQLLGYQPKVSLEEGIRRILKEDPRFRLS